MLEIAGLAAIEERAYRALVRMPAVRAEQLAEIIDARADETTKVLGALEEQGLASQGPDGQFRAIAPDRAFGPLLQRQQQRLAAVQSAIGLLTDEYRRRTAPGDAAELVEIIHGAAAIGRRIDHMQRAARSEVLWLVKPGGIRAEPATGPTHRAIYESPHSVMAGAQAKVMPDLPLTMMLVDRASVIVPVPASSAPQSPLRTVPAGSAPQAPLRTVPAGSAPQAPLRTETAEPSAVLVHPSGLLDALVALFERLWESASPLLIASDRAAAADRSVPGPSASDLHLLSLLIAGLTDHAIGAQLGLSTRTVQRRIRVLLELAGVQTRLQLVWHAAQRSWL